MERDPRFVTESQQWKTNQDIAILDDIILGAHKRIAMYEMLHNGMWYATFRSDCTDEILRERELIEEFKRMKQEIIEWQTKNTTQ